MASPRIQHSLDKTRDLFTLSSVSLVLHPEFLAQSKSRRYLLAISGGRDSVALLHALISSGYKKLILCHLNHSLRGRASGQDAAFVRRLAKKHSLECEVTRIDVARLSKDNGESIELAARNARHRFFADCSRKHHCKRILVAHHADDQAETILFNLLRGSAGLKGMRFSSPHTIGTCTLEFIRPLLNTSRVEINAYLTSQSINYREDASNAESFATRNRLRNEAIPLLQEIMRRDVRPALLRAAAISSSTESALTHLLDEKNLQDPLGRLFLPKLIELPPVLQGKVLYGYLKQHHIPDVSSDLLDRATSLLTHKNISKINLPGGRFLRRKEKRIFVSEH